MPDWLITLLVKLGISFASGAIIFSAGRFWTTLVRPWIENLWYQGFRLAPCYVGEFTLQGAVQNDLIDVKQKASSVWGTMTFPGGGQGVYHFKGVILDSVLRGTYEGTRRNPTVRGSFLLMNHPGKRELEGWFLEPYKGTVLAAPYKWTPKP